MFVLSSARRARSASLVSRRQLPGICVSRAGLAALGRFWFGPNERRTICVDAYGPGTVLVSSLATSPWPPVDCRRSLRTNPAPDVFCDSGMDDESWSGGGQLDSFGIRGAQCG